MPTDSLNDDAREIEVVESERINDSLEKDQVPSLAPEHREPPEEAEVHLVEDDSDEEDTLEEDIYTVGQERMRMQSEIKSQIESELRQQIAKATKEQLVMVDLIEDDPNLEDEEDEMNTSEMPRFSVGAEGTPMPTKGATNIVPTSIINNALLSTSLNKMHHGPEASPMPKPFSHSPANRGSIGPTQFLTRSGQPFSPESPGLMPGQPHGLTAIKSLKNLNDESSQRQSSANRQKQFKTFIGGSVQKQPTLSYFFNK